jgi:hypothetical protein
MNTNTPIPNHSTGGPAALSNNTAGHPPPIQGPPAIPAELFEAYASDASEADEREFSFFARQFGLAISP